MKMGEEFHHRGHRGRRVKAMGCSERAMHSLPTQEISACASFSVPSVPSVVQCLLQGF